MKIKTLRSHITLTICLIVMLSLFVSGLFLYRKTASILNSTYREMILQQLNQINKQIDEQVTLIDSLPPLFFSNTLIRDALDPANPQQQIPYSEKKLSVERQMNYLLINNYLRSEKLIDAVYLFDTQENMYSVTLESRFSAAENNRQVLKLIDPAETGMMIRSLPEDGNSIYFIRNIFSSYSGEPVATILINISQKSWIQYYSQNLNRDWFIYFYNQDMHILSDPRILSETTLLHTIADSSRKNTLQEYAVGGTDYLIAAGRNANSGITSIVAAPRTQILMELTATLKDFIWILLLIVFAALLVSIILSQAVTRPIDKMIYYVKRISEGKKEKMPALEMYSEFNQFADAFNHMLGQLDIYYRDNYEKQLLLKNAEIQALQSQMDPHFLFNVLNTIAWKAQMTDHEEVYQMVISLGELLKMNAVSKTSAFLPLKEELRYVRFYIYLQRMRFEDKITVDIQADISLEKYQVPCFCIQPLVENAIVHGLEPKKGPGKLIINIIPTKRHMEISVIDNGIGFQEIPDIQSIKSSAQDGHTHIALRNLDKRLFLLFGEESRLRISSIPNQCTTISFQVPYQSSSPS